MHVRSTVLRDCTLLFSPIGNIAVARSYVAAASTEKERSTVMSALSSVQGLGFILGPGRKYSVVTK